MNQEEFFYSPTFHSYVTLHIPGVKESMVILYGEYHDYTQCTGTITLKKQNNKIARNKSKNILKRNEVHWYPVTKICYSPPFLFNPTASTTTINFIIHLKQNLNRNNQCKWENIGTRLGRTVYSNNIAQFQIFVRRQNHAWVAPSSLNDDQR